MNKKLILPVLASLLIISFASAIEVCSTAETTYVVGFITQEGFPVDGADVQVDCNGNVKSTTSDVDGAYDVKFSADECDFGDSVSVSATKGSLNGFSNDMVDYTENFTVGCVTLTVNVAFTDVILVPEFGFIVGALTIVGAVGIFFFVRK